MMKHFRFALIIPFLLALAPVASGQDVRSELFQQADAALEAAKAARADVLAPKAFGKATEHYERAEKNLERGRDLEGIREDLRKATEYLGQAVEATELTKVTLSSAIQSRTDATEADARNYAPATWRKAEEKFVEAATALEDGDVNDSKKDGEAARKLYRQAELEAIQTNFLDETRKLLAQADREDGKKYAPVTLARSRELLASAESGLAKDRYDTDGPRNLAREAKYEAKHALQIAKVARDVDKNRMTVEGVVLALEKPLEKIASAADVVAAFDEAHDETALAVIAVMEDDRFEREKLTQELSERVTRVGELETTVATLEERLGGVSQESLAMERRLEAEAKVRGEFTRAESMFDREEARVLREGNELIVRLVGLQFESGKAVIRPANFSLLTKMQDAIRLFPGAQVRIEGHTDSYGTDEYNMELSNVRAEAVREYLTANMRMDASLITAVGYGETRPIANNETPDGRSRNRRIDVVIIPNLEAKAS